MEQASGGRLPGRFPIGLGTAPDGLRAGHAGGLSFHTMGTWARTLLLMLLLGAPGASAQEESAEAEPARAFDAIVLPLVSFNSDQGVGYGAVAGAYFYSPGYTPYRHAIAIQAFATTTGVRNHYLRYDGPRLLGPFRLEARFEYRRELLAPYFGGGNLSAPDFGGDLRDPRFNYERFAPGLWVRLRGRPGGAESPLEVYGGLAYRKTEVTAFDGSILEEQRPQGLTGGETGQLLAGALWDTRDNEADATSGGAEEFGVRASLRGVGSRYSYVGITLVERRYFRLTDRVVFAQRFLFDALLGDVPFFEWPNLGGISYTEGVGGLSSVRGVPRNRFAGNTKLISNTELRVQVTDFKLFNAPVKLGVVGFFDAGRVWHPGVEDGPWHAWHPGTGLGLRAARRAAVVRFDAAVSTETWRPAFYVTFGHIF